MKGVISPGVSAGSNHEGDSETWTRQIGCPAPPPPSAIPGAPATTLAAVSASNSRRDTPGFLSAEIIKPVSETDFAIACSLLSRWRELARTVERRDAQCLYLLVNTSGWG